MPLMLALYGLKEILNNKKTVTLKTFAQLNASLRRGRRFAKLQQKRPPCVKGAVEHSETGGLSAVKLLNEQSLHRQNPLANLTVGPLSRLPPRSVLLDFVQWLPQATRTL